MQLMSRLGICPPREEKNEGSSALDDSVLSAQYLPFAPALLPVYSTCSAYALEAVEKYGALKGGWLALRRVLRCNPFHRQKSIEYDPVP